MSASQPGEDSPAQSGLSGLERAATPSAAWSQSSGKAPLLFLGLADHFQSGPQPYPYGGVDLFQLGLHKIHIVYPGIIQGSVWVFLIHTDFLGSKDALGLQIKFVHESGWELGTSTLTAVVPSDPELSEQSQSPAQSTITPSSYHVALGSTEYILLPISLETLVNFPGKYNVSATYGGVISQLGTVEFHYKAAPALSPDQIAAIQSDPGSAKTIFFEYGCKHCPTKLRTYAGLSKSTKKESEGAIWYADLPDEFMCGCSRTRFPLNYVRESLHGLLLKDMALAASGLSYVRQYGHSQVTGIVDRFRKLLDAEKLESPVQTFIEKNPILLARFDARRLFVKPNILGKFQADFAVVDSNNELCFIEIERPSMKLFKKNGHPTADLIHAFEQVRDWLNQFRKHTSAVHESLKLRTDAIVGVRGAVIAGRSASVTHDVLQRHHMSAPYPNIDLMTYDDLASSLVNLSRKLA